MSKAMQIVQPKSQRVARPSEPEEPDDRDLERARKYFAKSKSENTKRMYAMHWAEFVEYCTWRKRTPLPANAKAVVGYLSFAADAGCAPATLRQKLAAISYVHRNKKLPVPSQFAEVVALMQGIVRDKQHQPRQLHPLTRDELRRLINAIAKHSPTPRAERDTAIILVGYAGLFRRSEITGLKFEDVRVTGEEISLLLRESKTDQEGKGQLIPLPHLPAADADICPTRALQVWLGVLRQHGLTAGKIFRSIRRGLTENISNDGLSDQSVNLIVKRWAKVIGIAPDTIGAHSALRAGMATQMSRKGVSMDVIKKSGRWKSDAVAFGYIRRTQKEQQEAKVNALLD